MKYDKSGMEYKRVSGGLTPCRQLRPSSRREHVRASNSQMGWKKRKKERKKDEHIQTIKQLIKVCTAQLPSKTLKSLPV